jgi:glucose/arabinose dehydrogenase
MIKLTQFSFLKRCSLLIPLLILAADPIEAEVPLTIALDKVVNGLSNPVCLTHAGDGYGRLFVVEQVGKIKIIQNGNLLGVPFLNIQSRVTSGGETGLLSVAFHPNFKNNRRLFVNYTAQRPNLKTIIAEYQASLGNPNVADTAEKVLLTIDQPFDNHNGGQLQFGPDGYLYIGMGDGGSGGDPQGNGQNDNVLLGKLLRINVDGGSPYAVPVDNPFVGAVGADEIWASGLRNPWRFSFDRANGRLFAGDVGQNSYEEVDIIERGGNYGWNIMEGNHCYAPSTGCNTSGFKLPINEYDHSVEAVTGGYVYRGRQFPQLTGIYLFADFGSSRIWALRETNRGSWNRTQLLEPGFKVSSFGEDESGELYVVDYGGSIQHVLVTNPSPVSDKILIPSSARSDQFASLLFVVNRETSTNNILVTGWDTNGLVVGTLSLVLNPGGFFRTIDILGALQLPKNSFGPLTVESTNGEHLSAISEIRSAEGTAGFFSGLSEAAASAERIIPEVVDSGDPGIVGTFRTDLGVNNPNGSAADVEVSFLNGSGLLLGRINQQVPPRGMLLTNNIVRKILGVGSATGNQGYLRLVSSQPFHVWASKIDNSTDDPSLEVGVGEEIEMSGTQLLIPSVSGTDRFRTLLVVVNRENAPSQITLTARDSNGVIIGRANRTIPSSGTFRSTDILSELGAPLGSFGPLTVESKNGELMAAISEVRSLAGTAGFFPAVSLAGATLAQVMGEVLDTGDRGTANTSRTNLGINNLGSVVARAAVLMQDSLGHPLGSLNTTIPPGGLRQINDIARAILGSQAPSGVSAYLKVTADQLIYAWVSKIDNATDDPSIVMGSP